MTENKRFTLNRIGRERIIDGIIDNQTDTLLDNQMDFCDLLNELHEENQRLKGRIQEYEGQVQHQRTEDINELAVIAIKYKALENENNHIKNTIQEAYYTERTDMGKSVLKQLAESLEITV